MEYKESGNNKAILNPFTHIEKANQNKTRREPNPLKKRDLLNTVWKFDFCKKKDSFILYNLLIQACSPEKSETFKKKVLKLYYSFQ